MALTAGDRAAHLGYLRGGVVAKRIIGAVFVGVALVLALVAALIRRSARGKQSNRK